MSRSLAKQLDFGAALTKPADPNVSAASEFKNFEIREENRADDLQSAPINFPTFRGSDEVYAATARMAGRINAASVTEEEHQRLLAERQILLDKKFEGSLTRKESNRLEYVRWSLDRIEDAKYGAVLDALENSVAKYEDFLEQVKSLGERLSEYIAKRK